MTTTESPIIGLGCQRSGTSITGRVLAAPKSSAFHVENGIIRLSLIWFSNAFHDGTALAAARFNEFLRALMVRSEGKGTPLQEAVKEALGRYRSSGRLREWVEADDGVGFVRQLCFDVLTRGVEDEAPYWGDKYPEHLFFGRELQTVFPDAKWLFVWREPASVIEALSRKRSAAALRETVADCRRQWVGWNEEWLKLREQIPAGKRLEIHFDTFVSDPQAGLAQMSEFVGFDLMSDRKSKRVAGALRPGDLEKWRRSPHADEIAQELEHEDVRRVHAALKQGA